MCEVTAMNDDLISRAETIKMLRALMGAAVTGPEQALVEAAVHVAEAVQKAEVNQVRHGRWYLRCSYIRDYGTGEQEETYYLECSRCHRKIFGIDQFAAMRGDLRKVIKPYTRCKCGANMDM